MAPDITPPDFKPEPTTARRLAVQKAPAQPLALSTVAPYSSWVSLTDLTWFARYLPPRAAAGHPPLDDVAALFKVGRDGPRVSQRSTLLFPSFAQWFTDGCMMPGLIGRMVAADAFSHALTNPLLSPHVFNGATFSPEGMRSINATGSMRDLLLRNALRSARPFVASMEQEGADVVA